LAHARFAHPLVKAIDLERILADYYPLDRMDMIHHARPIVGFSQTVKAGVGDHLHQMRRIADIDRGGLHIDDLHPAQLGFGLGHGRDDTSASEHATGLMWCSFLVE